MVDLADDWRSEGEKQFPGVGAGWIEFCLVPNSGDQGQALNVGPPRSAAEDGGDEERVREVSNEEGIENEMRKRSQELVTTGRR